MKLNGLEISGIENIVINKKLYKRSVDKTVVFDENYNTILGLTDKKLLNRVKSFVNDYHWRVWVNGNTINCEKVISVKIKLHKESWIMSVLQSVFENTNYDPKDIHDAIHSFICEGCLHGHKH